MQDYTFHFYKGKDQPSILEVEGTCTIVNAHIHAERVVGAVHQKYSVLQATLPIEFIIKPGEDCPHTDKIVHTSCSL